MQHLMKRCATILVLATTAVAVVPMTAMADRAVIKQGPNSHDTKVKVVKKNTGMPLVTDSASRM